MGLARHQSTPQARAAWSGCHRGRVAGPRVPCEWCSPGISLLHAVEEPDSRQCVRQRHALRREERATGRKDRRMRLFAEAVAELDLNMRWVVPLRLQLIDEVVCDPESFGVRTPGVEEAWGPVRLALAQRNRKAEDKADYRAHEGSGMGLVAELFRVSTSHQALYARAARQGDKTATADSKRVPFCLRGHPRLPGHCWRTSRTRIRWTPRRSPPTLQEFLQLNCCPRIGKPTRQALRHYMGRSESNPAYFDALTLLCEELDKQGEPSMPTRPVATGGGRWVAGRAPPWSPSQPTAPPIQTSSSLICTSSSSLRSCAGLAYEPRGPFPSGCLIVSEVLSEVRSVSEDTVERLWKERTWEKSFVPIMQKYSRAIAERTGLHCC